MSKTFMYILFVIAVYVFIIFPGTTGTTKTGTDNKPPIKVPSKKSGTGLSDNTDENGVSQGAAGQQRYRIGYTK